MLLIVVLSRELELAAARTQCAPPAVDGITRIAKKKPLGLLTQFPPRAPATTASMRCLSPRAANTLQWDHRHSRADIRALRNDVTRAEFEAWLQRSNAI
jgi:hypothetical protein